MTLEAIIVWAIIGAIAGWLAGLIMTGGGFGLIGNIIIGILGAVIAALLFPRLGWSLNLGSPIINEIVVSTIGAVILLFIVGLVRR